MVAQAQYAYLQRITKVFRSYLYCGHICLKICFEYKEHVIHATRFLKSFSCSVLHNSISTECQKIYPARNSLTKKTGSRARGSRLLTSWIFRYKFIFLCTFELIAMLYDRRRLSTETWLEIFTTLRVAKLGFRDGLCDRLRWGPFHADRFQKKGYVAKYQLSLMRRFSEADCQSGKICYFDHH